jgi:hypothetical protein
MQLAANDGQTGKIGALSHSISREFLNYMELDAT